jgi:putative transposase
MPPPRYPSDLSDEEWTILKPRCSRPPKWPLRHVAEAVFYLLRSGCSWRMLPREYPTAGSQSTISLPQVEDRRRTVSDERTTGCKMRCERRRDANAIPQRRGRRQPQVVKTTPVGGPERGYDGAKRLAGRKRHLLSWILTG